MRRRGNRVGYQWIEGATVISLLLLLAGTPVKLTAQFTNEFSVGEYAEFYDHDSIRIFFNCSGKICRQSCASFYRTGIIDKQRINVRGLFRDYYMNDTVAFEAVMLEGYLEGKGNFYHANGRIKCTGSYKKGVRTGIWRFYHEDGTLKQIINYVDGFPLITDYFNDRGRQLVRQGEGKYTGEYRTFRSCEPFIYEGKVKDGLLDGKIQISNAVYRGVIGYEFYSRGKFLRGSSGSYNYKENPKIELPGFNVHEQLIFDENTVYCPGFLGTSFIQYDNKLYWEFYTLLLDSLHKNIHYKVEDQWLAVSIGIDSRDQLYDVNVFSSKDDYRLERDLFNILIRMQKWETAQVFWRKVSSDLFFTILITHGRVIIPAEIMRKKGLY